MKDTALSTFQIIPEQLSRSLQLINAASDMPMGHIVNISSDSLVMVSRLPILLKAEFDLLIEVPTHTRSGAFNKIELSAVCMWSCKDDEGCYYDSGFEIFKRSKQLAPFIKALDSYFLFKSV